MSDPTTLRAFFGDSERAFALTDAMIAEMEHLTGTGTGALHLKIVASQYGFSELVEVIRPGLIGGSCNPEEAHRLVSTHARNRPIAEVFPLAPNIMDVRHSGAAGETLHARDRADVENGGRPLSGDRPAGWRAFEASRRPVVEMPDKDNIAANASRILLGDLNGYRVPTAPGFRFCTTPYTLGRMGMVGSSRASASARI